MSAQEIRRELAVHLYLNGKLSISKASELAALDRIDLQRLLSARGIPVNDNADDFRDDVEMIARLTLDQ
jgi:predicted HTH domain antitoxin